MFDGRNQFEPEDLRSEGFDITAWGGSLMQHRILVTGAGFIGSHLCERLL